MFCYFSKDWYRKDIFFQSYFESLNAEFWFLVAIWIPTLNFEDWFILVIIYHLLEYIYLLVLLIMISGFINCLNSGKNQKSWFAISIAGGFWFSLWKCILFCEYGKGWF